VFTGEIQLKYKFLVKYLRTPKGRSEFIGPAIFLKNCYTEKSLLSTDYRLQLKLTVDRRPKTVDMRNFLIPHPHTHKKAHLLTTKAFLIYIFIFLGLNLITHNNLIFNKSGGQVLGESTSMSVKDLISLTNVERAKNGLSALKENAELDQAASAKAQNMFAENYWAHYSPSGKDPWGFILAAGYKFTYAGENLAKNFHSASDVVVAWMNSPTHRENLLNPHYTDIGMAVADGNLQGSDTILVVQEFGAPATVIALAPTPSPVVPVPTINPAELPNTAQNPAVVEVPNNSKPQIVPVAIPPAPTLDAFSVAKNASIALIGFIAMLLAVDFVMLRKRGVVRVNSHHWSHFALLAVAGASIAVTQNSSILEGISTIIK
jgi:uncharacterized protein YkwD